MFNSVEEYLAELKKELSGSDRATIQDALSDAEEYLRTALGTLPAGDRASGGGTLSSVISKYGAPAEVAAAYRQIESHTPSALAVMRDTETPAQPARPGLRETRPFYARFFGIFADPKAWGSFLYLLFTLATGIMYFTWVVTGISVSLGLLVLVIGLPIAGLFLLSVRGIALIEGRLVEALLGVRMPRRPRFAGKTGIWQQFKNLITDKHTWFSMAYMLLQMPLGTIYFSLFITLLSIALALAAWPIVALAMGLPVLVIGSQEYFGTGLLIPISIVAGALLLTATMHLAKAIGRAHGAVAKALLVRP
jgi:hypothetical protein